MSGGYFVRSYELWRYTDNGRDPVTGAPIEEWEKIDDIPGRAYPASVSNSVIGSVDYGSLVWTFATSPEHDIRIADQIRFDDHKLEVKAVPITSRGDRCEIRCKELQ